MQELLLNWWNGDIELDVPVVIGQEKNLTQLALFMTVWSDAKAENVDILMIDTQPERYKTKNNLMAGRKLDGLSSG